MFPLRLIVILVMVGCGSPVGGVSELTAPGSASDAGSTADAGSEPQTSAFSEEIGDAAGPDASDASTPRQLTPTVHDDPTVDATIRAWRKRFETIGDVLNPDQLACAERIDQLEVVVPSNARFRRLCQRCNTVDDHSACDRLGRIFACAPVEYGAAYVVLDPVMAEVERKRVALIIHETIHHLGACSDEDPDPEHRYHDWWCGQPEGCIEGEAFADVMGS